MDKKTFETICQSSVDSKVVLSLNGESGGTQAIIKALRISALSSHIDCVNDYIEVIIIGNGHRSKRIDILDIWQVAKKEEK